ncbi:hypothetical protein PR048_007183 [Dryococelus australis]|uniref:Uncharacterized protein n=1 Tax=Dryococelus australis TaxID=614101 RepID=A0ABQ9ID28_9NEOP|nr:hypothetical protein PR048_007183 [Dryococelus australis]
MSAYTRKKAKPKYRNRIRDTHKIPYDRVKRCRGRKINAKASERVNLDPECAPVPKTYLRRRTRLRLGEEGGKINGKHALNPPGVHKLATSDVAQACSHIIHSVRARQRDMQFILFLGAGSPDFLMRESCQTMSLIGTFSLGSPVSPDPQFRRCPILTSIALIGSEDSAVKSRPNPFAHSLLFLTMTLSLRVFSATSRSSPSLHFGAAPYSPRFTLIGSQDTDVKSRANLPSSPPTPVETVSIRISDEISTGAQKLYEQPGISIIREVGRAGNREAWRGGALLIGGEHEELRLLASAEEKRGCVIGIPGGCSTRRLSTPRVGNAEEKGVVRAVKRAKEDLRGKARPRQMLKGSKTSKSDLERSRT